MKSRVSIFLLFITFICALQGQKGQLLMDNTSNKKVHAIEEGQKISVYLSESSFVKGELVLIDSTSIAIGKDTIPLSKIYSIEAKSKQVQTKGGILIGIGAAFILGGVAAMGAASNQKDSSFDLTSGLYEGTGIGLFAIGGIMTTAGIICLASGKNYKSSTWEYSVR